MPWEWGEGHITISKMTIKLLILAKVKLYLALKRKKKKEKKTGSQPMAYQIGHIKSLSSFSKNSLLYSKSLAEINRKPSLL